MKIKDLPKVDMPREKLEKYSPEKLHDYELLAILLGSGIKGTNVLELSRKILKVIRDIGLDRITLKDLREIRGLGRAKAAQIVAVLELRKRLNADQNPEILSSLDVWKLCADIRDSKREHFVAFYLDTQNRLIERRIISIGTLNSSLVHPREVFEPALTLHAASVIVAHNHPSQNLEPSQSDRGITKRLQEVGSVIGIPLENHVILSSKECLSFTQKGLM